MITRNTYPTQIAELLNYAAGGSPSRQVILVNRLAAIAPIRGDCIVWPFLVVEHFHE